MRLCIDMKVAGLSCDGINECSHGCSHYGVGGGVDVARTGITRWQGGYHLHRTRLVFHHIHAVGSAVGNTVNDDGGLLRHRAAVCVSHHFLFHLLTGMGIAYVVLGIAIH